MKSFIDFQKEEVELDEVSTPIKNKVQDRKTGKWYDPTKEFNKLMDKPEVKAQMKRMAKTDVKEEVESDTPFEGPYKQSKGTVTDKSGAKHTPLSNVRSLARNAIEKMKQKMRMAHLSPEVRAEKLARNEELVGGQKKLDVDKDGKIEKSDLEILRAKKLKEDVTTATQRLKAALDRHVAQSLEASRTDDFEKRKVHQDYIHKIKTQLGKLAKNEEVEIDEDVTTAAQKLKAALDRHTEHAVAANRAGDHDAVKVHQGYANKIKTQLGKLAKNEEVEIDEAAPTGIKIYHKGQDDKEAHSMVFSAADAAKHEKELKQQGRKVTGRAVMSGKTEGPRKNVTEEVEIDEASRAKLTNYISAAKSDEKKDRSAGIKLAQKKKWGDEKHGTVSAKVPANEEVEIDEASMTDAEMAKREKIVKGMKKSYKDFTTKYGDRAKEVMYATATKKAMEEEVEEELEEDMDEGVTTRNGAVTVHKGTYGTSYQPSDDEDDEDTPEKKEPAVKRGRGRPAGAKSGAKPKGSSAGKSYGGVAIHSLRLPNNNK